jgi:hypothetical protein
MLFTFMNLKDECILYFSLGLTGRHRNPDFLGFWVWVWVSRTQTQTHTQKPKKPKNPNLNPNPKTQFFQKETQK